MEAPGNVNLDDSLENLLHFMLHRIGDPVLDGISTCSNGREVWISGV